MQHIAIGASGIAGLILLIMCCFWGKTKGQTSNAFVINNLTVEVAQDTEGLFNVVRMEGNGKKSTLPKNLILPMEPPNQMFALNDVPNSVIDTDPTITGADTMQQLRHLADTGVDAYENIPGASADVMALTTEAQDTSSRFHINQRVVLQGLIGYSELNGVYGWLVSFESDTGFWWVALDGFDELNQVPESCLADVLPDEHVLNTDWLVAMRSTEGRVLETKRKHQANFQTQEQRAETEIANAINKALEATAAERVEVDAAMRKAMANGDAEALRKEAVRARALLEQVAGAPSASTAGLKRLLQTAESRLEQFDEREAARNRQRAYHERISRGEAADWKMTPVEFWKYVEVSNLEKVRAGVRAKLPLFTRSTDGQRLTIVHVACRGACTDAEDSDKASKRLAVVETLLRARAHVNAVDIADRTPLDLAVCEGGEGANALSAVKALRDLGLRTAQEAAAEAREVPAN